MLRRTTLLVLLVLAVTAPACSRGGGASEDVPYVDVDPASASPTDRAIADAQSRLRSDEGDADAQLDLTQAFLQKARETADPTLYTNAEQLLDRLREAAPDDPQVLVARGTLALAQHRFADALDHGERALEAAPDNPGAYGVIIDANNELGRYDEALAAGEAMLAIRPDLPALARASYARELRGDLQGAVVAMSQAVTAESSGGGGENLAFVQVQLGNLLVTTGELGQAATAYDDANRSFADFPAAKAGRARLMVARGDYDEAAELLEEVVDVQPSAEYAINWGDALHGAGEKDQAKEAYSLVGAIAKLYEANGVNVDLELALFDAERDPGDDAVARARRALEDRPSIFGHDALAWNLFRAGDVDEAAVEMKRALVTDTADPQFRFHAAAIAEAAGDRKAAAEHLKGVLSTNPRFSAVLADDVEALADELGLTVPPPPPDS